jgi:hypothetical protein
MCGELPIFGAIMVNQMGLAHFGTVKSSQARAGRDQRFLGGNAMTFVPVMWSVWGALVVLMACVHVYRGNLEKDEDDQIFLDDSFSHERAEQGAIVARVNKVQPILNALKWSVVAMTLVVVGYYIYDILAKLDIIHS